MILQPPKRVNKDENKNVVHIRWPLHAGSRLRAPVSPDDTEQLPIFWRKPCQIMRKWHIPRDLEKRKRNQVFWFFLLLRSINQPNSSLDLFDDHTNNRLTSIRYGQILLNFIFLKHSFIELIEKYIRQTIFYEQNHDEEQQDETRYEKLTLYMRQPWFPDWQQTIAIDEKSVLLSLIYPPVLDVTNVITNVFDTVYH